METLMKASTVIVNAVNTEAVARYKEMRSALMGGLDDDQLICEILITTQLALLGLEVPFKLHAKRLLDLGVTKEAVQRYLLAGVGVTTVIGQAARSLEWLDEACTSQASK
jgi:hypothetical protein